MGRISNLIPSHVSIVDKAANKRSFLLVKDDTQPNVETDVRLLKRDEEQQIVYGVVYEPDVVDAHGDFMDADEIEKAAHVFLKEFRNVDKQHDFTSKVGEVIESYIAPADFELGGQTVTKGTWMMAVKVVDDVWTGIQKGEFTGFSLAGYGNVEKSEGAILATLHEGEMVLTKDDTSFLAKLKKFFAPLLEHEQVQKEQGEEVMTMTKDELQAVVDEAVEKAVTKALAKAETPEEPASPQAEPDAEPVVEPEVPAEPEAEPTEQTELAKAMQEIEELKKQLDARPVAFSSGAEVTKTETPEKKSYLKHFG